jgi:UDP-N-acetylmuramyl pentapeptide phosphotransferase/UDP-N-acetylglucosamine-1-phosphate transferase
VSSNVVTLSLMAVVLASFGVCALLILTQRWHGTLSLDHDLTGAQKVHHNPVPRVGGIGVMAGLLVGVFIGYANGGETWPFVVKLLLCAAPAFAAGLIEDLTKRVSVRTRLLASFASAGLAAWTLGATLTRLNTPMLDDVMAWAPAAVLFTCFAVGGMTNAINIIDGLNGLASGAVALMLAGLAGIAWQAGDMLVMKMCLWGIAALVGFMVLNYPFGQIFLGDGGAYLSGFWLAECAVLLLHRNPEVSTWAVLLSVMYPVWETVYSMYRRHVVNKVSSGQPDMNHLHHLVFCRLIGQRMTDQRPAWMRHGLSSGFIWLLVVGCQLMAMAGASNTPLMIFGVVLFILTYQFTYTLIARTHALPVEDDGAPEVQVEGS